MHVMSKISVATAAIVWASTASAQGACSALTSTATYDYIIVGAGAAGIPMADKLSEAGKSVLLVEKGPPSTGLWGGTLKPEWLEGTNLTRFDVPGLCNQIWADAEGVACTDTDQMAGCVLGGGVAVNAGLWWKPHPDDWDVNFPAGWKSADVVEATKRAFERIPGTYIPSQDNQLYLQQGFNVLSSGLKNNGFTEIVANDHPDQKNHTYSHSTFMFSGGERGGPLATYLVTAAQRKNFQLYTDTNVRKIIRSKGHATGVEIECNEATGNGLSGIINVTPDTGRVILAAGTFGSAKLLLRSGIGPTDQLNVVKSTASDGPSMQAEADWINLPVGQNLHDHVGTDIEVAHPDVVFYDFYAAWTDPIEADKNKYLAERAGILAQAAPNLGPLFWETVKGSDGANRHFQWSARVEGQTNTSMTVTQYLGTGQTSRGRMTITRRLDTFVQTAPYLRDPVDKAAAIQALGNTIAKLKTIPGLTFITPAPNVTAAAYFNSLPETAAKRRANHWMGTAKMGTDSGLTGGTSVVDTNLKVYGTDNIFVIDGSIFPGQITGNPSAMIVIVAEHSSQKILALQ